MLIHKNFQGKIPSFGTLTSNEKELEKEIPDISQLTILMQNNQWHHVVEQIWNYINRCNKYIADTEPWKQTDSTRLGTILYTALEHLRIISILTWPVIPKSAEKIAAQIGQPLGTLKDAKFKKSTHGIVSTPEILFKKIELQKTETPKNNEAEDPFAKLQLKVAKIEKVDIHSNADKLYVLTLNAGTETKQIVSGIRPHYTPEQLVGKHIVLINNMSPANFRGVQSNGMLLAGEKEGIVRVAETHAAPGTPVMVQGISPGTTQITIADFQKVKLNVKNKHIIYNNTPLKTPDGLITVDLPDGATVR